MPETRTRLRLTEPAPLTEDHDVSSFDCGSPKLDSWLKQHALQSEGRTARTYVTCEAPSRVVGYYCVSSGSVERQALPSRMKRQQGIPNQIPVTILGRLARHIDYRGSGLGEDLLRDALLRILNASRVIGSRAVLVHALDVSAQQFWADHEFIEFPVGSRTLFLPMETIADAL